MPISLFSCCCLHLLWSLSLPINISIMRMREREGGVREIVQTSRGLCLPSSPLPRTAQNTCPFKPSKNEGNNECSTVCPSASLHLNVKHAFILSSFFSPFPSLRLFSALSFSCRISLFPSLCFVYNACARADTHTYAGTHIFRQKDKREFHCFAPIKVCRYLFRNETFLLGFSFCFCFFP